jgi:Flp pilus assembly pilin Flp
MLNVIKGFVRDEDGLEMVEWAIVAALITTAAVASLNLLGAAIAARYTQVEGIVNP